MRNKILIILIVFALLMPGFVLAEEDVVEENIIPDPEIKLFNEFGNIAGGFDIQEEDFKGGLNIAGVDLGGDGIEEILIGLGKENMPLVKIFRQDGTLVNEFLAFPQGFRGGVELIGCDLNNDGSEEIITAPSYDGGPQIRILNGFGEPVLGPGFFVDEKEKRIGLELACGDVNGDLKKEIIVAIPKNNKYIIKAYNFLGGEVIEEFEAFNYGTGEISLASLDVDLNGVEDIIVGSPIWQDNKVKMFKNDGTLIHEFSPYGDAFTGGVDVAVDDIDNDGFKEIITSPIFNGGPHIRVFNLMGRLLYNGGFFAYNDKFRGGTKIALVNNKIATTPRQIYDDIKNKGFKYIEIDISDQRMFYYQNGYQLGTYRISSGKWDMPTPLGEFKVLSKADVAYSAKYDLYMPNWMAFTYWGHGIHGLPYWKYDWGIAYEGVWHLGYRVSHGCVRLPLDGAKIVYNWADIGTKVVVHE